MMMLPSPFIRLAAARNRSIICCSISSRWKLPQSYYYKRCFSSVSATEDDIIKDDDDDESTTTNYNVSPINTCLALNVRFRHPDLGMKDYEILSRATAFLLQVDPPDEEDEEEDTSNSKNTQSKSSSFPHLSENINLRKRLLQKQDYKYNPATGPKRTPSQLNWLEFCPTAFRPKVHIVASSHVVSPFLWPKYYNQDWLKIVTQEHVRYSLEVWGSSSSDSSEKEEVIKHDGKLKGNYYQPLAKFALNPYPIHHPNEMDVAVIHLKDEDEALDHMKKLGIHPLIVPTMYEFEQSQDPVFEPGERVLFQGFEVYEDNKIDQEILDSSDDDGSKNQDKDDDKRVFHPYSSMGTLSMASPDRFLAKTDAPLPEGLCGGPAIKLPSSNNNTNTTTSPSLTIRGVVEGIVPINHENKELAGMASFLPSYRIREFVDYAERIMLEQIIDEDLFQKVVELKEKKDVRGTTYSSNEFKLPPDITNKENDDDDLPPKDPNVRVGIEGTRLDDSAETPHIDREYQDIISSLRKNHTPEEVDAILATVEREREEVIKIMEKEGGDMDDVIEAVRRKTYDEKTRIMEEIEHEMKKKGIIEGEIVKEDKEP